MNNGVEMQRLQLEAAVDVAKRLGIPLVATSDAHYVNQEDAEAQDVLLCINTGKFRTDTNRMRMENDSVLSPLPEEMYAAFPGLEDAVARSQEIADCVEHRPGAGQAALSRRFSCRRRRRPKIICASCASRVCKERYADDEEMLPGGELVAGRAGAARARAGGHQQAGLSELLPDRLGLRAATPASRASRPRPAAAASGRWCAMRCI